MQIRHLLCAKFESVNTWLHLPDINIIFDKLTNMPWNAAYEMLRMRKHFITNKLRISLFTTKVP